MDSSAFSPFRVKVFRSLWVANLTSHMGTWMKDVAVSWLMIMLAPTPMMVSLVQVAGTLPMFLFSIPAGALADLVDRRKILLIAQAFMVTVSATMVVFTFCHWLSPWILLLLTFLMGSGLAFGRPASESITLDLVSQEEFPKAAGLNSAGFNIARATGPALGGWLVAVVGAAWAFVLNTFSFLGVIYVILRWERVMEKKPHHQEKLLKAIVSGFRYAKNSVSLQAVYIRGASFIFFASCLWALLPIVTKMLLLRGPEEYGLLLGFFGAGAVSGALFLPWVKRRWATDDVVAGMTLVFALGMFSLSYVQAFYLACFVVFFCGHAWLVVLSTFSVCVQTRIPDALRARAVSIYMLIFFGSMSLGSALWGTIATGQGLVFALRVASLGLALVLTLRRRYSLHAGPGDSPSAGLYWPVPRIVPSQR